MTQHSSHNTGPDNAHTSKARPGKIGRILKRTLLLLLLAVTLTAAALIYLTQSEPAYWKQHQQFLRQTSPKQIQTLNQQVENKLQELANLGLDEAQDKADPAVRSLNELVSPDEAGETQPVVFQDVRLEDVPINIDTTMTLDNQQIAAVIQTRLDQWMLNRGYVRPNEIKDPMVTIYGGKLVMAFHFQTGRYAAVISGKFNLNILDNGMAELTLSRFLVGQLPVPADALGQYLREKSGGDRRAQQAGEWLGKLQYLQFKPVLELEHRRRARLMDYQTLDDGIELTVRVQDHLTYKAMNQALAGVPTD